MTVPETALPSAAQAAPGARVLPAGTRFDGLEITGVIAEGTSTIVYRARAETSGEAVALMEYMPARLARRGTGGELAPIATTQARAYQQGLEAFLDEAQALARCDHPALVSVLRAWEARGTAYRSMPLAEGRRLLDARRDMTEPPDEDALRDLLEGLLGALEAWHREGGLHEGVTPTNILLLADDRPVLLGPGAAGRATTNERIASLMTSVEPSFAPIEQIVPTADMPLGPSADLYALAGVLRYCITGQLPPPALGVPGTARREPLREVVQRLRKSWPELKYSAALLETLDAALSFDLAQRPQSVAQFRAWLDAGPPGMQQFAEPPAAAAFTPAAVAAMHKGAEPWMTAGPAQPLGADLLQAVAATPFRPAARQPARSHRQMLMWAAVGLLALTILAVLVVRELDRPREVGPILAAGAGATPAPDTPPPATATNALPIALPSEPTAAGPAALPSVTLPRVAALPVPAAVAPRTKPVPASPREACSGRTEFSLYRCMKTQCSQAAWKNHAQCEQLRRTDRVD